MKHFAAFFFLLFLSLGASADTADATVKPFTIGIGSYASTVAYDQDLLGDDDFSGLALTFGYAISDNFALRGTYFMLEHQDFSDFESTGVDLLAYYGTGLATHGFKAYIGGGFFGEEWELGSLNESFNGLQLSGGIGYNWSYVALELILGIRDASDYEEFVNRTIIFNDVDAAAVSGSLLLSYRF